MSPLTYQPSHKLSIKSTQLKRNLFVWSLDVGRPGLRGGLELRECNQVTPAILYRWIVLVLTFQDVRWSGDRPQDVERNSFDLYHAIVTPDPDEDLSYSVVREGDALSRTSNDPLKCGELGICPSDESAGSMIDFPTETKVASFVDLEANMRFRGFHVKHQDPPSDGNFRTRVVARDGRCLITGTSAPAAESLTVTWIYPPWLGTRIYAYEFPKPGVAGPLKPIRDDESVYVGMNNAISLRADVADLFKRNQLGIDVDDDYRVVFFGFPDTLEPKPECQIRLDLTTTGDKDTRPSEKLLRRHFQHCLMVNFFGGDVLEDHRVL